MVTTGNVNPGTPSQVVPIRECWKGTNVCHPEEFAQPQCKIWGFDLSLLDNVDLDLASE